MVPRYQIIFGTRLDSALSRARGLPARTRVDDQVAHPSAVAPHQNWWVHHPTSCCGFFPSSPYPKPGGASLRSDAASRRRRKKSAGSDLGNQVL